MIVEVNYFKNNLFIRLNGDLDMHTVPEFKKTVSKELKKNNFENLILFFKEVDFIDSTGIGAILGRYRNLKSKNREMILVGLRPQVKKVFELSGLLKLMPVYETEKDLFSEYPGQKEENI